MTKTEELQGKVVLVAGASRPVGRAIASYFGARGAALVLPVYSDWPEANEQMNRQFVQDGFNFLSISCDLSDAGQVKMLIDEVAERYGHLHYLVNNIERGGMPVVHGSYDLEVNREQWRLEFETTLKAKWNLYRHCFDLLKKEDDGGVVNISSIAAHVGRSGPASLLFSDGYSAANRGIGSFTRQWARELAPNIRVNEVMIGLIAGRHGEQTRGWSTLTGKQQLELTGHTLAGRTGTPEELAELVYFVAVRARYMTGGTVLFDGGYLLGGDRARAMPPGILG